MLNSIKATAKDAIIYGFGNITVKIVGLILIPVYTDPEYFSIDEFGIIGLLEITGLVIISLLTFSLPHSFFRWYWDKEYRENQKGLFFMTLVSQVVISTIICALLIPLSGSFSGILFGTADWSKVIVLVILSSAFQVINNLVNVLMRLQSRSALYSIANILKLIVILSLTLFFILSENMGIEGIYLAQVTGNILFLLFLSPFITSNCTIYFNFRSLREMNSYGLPLFLGAITSVLLNVIDRYSLNSLSLLKSVALYTLAIKLSSVIKVVLVDSVRLTVMSVFMKKMDSYENRRLHSKIHLYSSFVVMFAIIGLSMFSLEIIKVISKSRDFWDAVYIVPILSLSAFFINMKEITLYGLYITKKSRVISIIVVSATLLNLLLNILLIPLWDITGAAVSTLLSQIFYWYICYYFSQKYYPVPHETKKLFILFIAGALISFTSLSLSDVDLIVRLGIKILLIIIFPGLLYFFRFYEPVEIMAIKGFVKKWSNIKMFKKNLLSLKDIKDED